MDLAELRGVETDVYQPAEDSALLAAEATSNVGPDDLVLEVGTGSGYVAERIAGATGARAVGADVNPHACEQARDRGVEAVRADLVAPFRDATFDAVLFNPPYLPAEGEGREPCDAEAAIAESASEEGERSSDASGATASRDENPADEQGAVRPARGAVDAGTDDADEGEIDWMERALTGGEDGRAVIDPFLDSVGRVLAPDGEVFLLVSSLTGVEDVVARAAENGFSAVALRDESFPFETLSVLKLVR